MAGLLGDDFFGSHQGGNPSGEHADGEGEDQQQCDRHTDTGKENVDGLLLKVLKNDNSHENDNNPRCNEFDFLGIHGG